MTSKNAPVAGNGNKEPCADDCACPSNDNIIHDATAAAAPAQKRGFLRRIFGKSALCTCSGAGGFLIGHAGCVITPLVLAAVGATTATAGVSLLALSFGAAATAGGLYAWHRLRGHQATKFEKRLVIGSALSGLLISGALMHFGGHEHHGDRHQHPHGAPTEQTVPAPANNHHNHHDHHGHHGQQGALLTPAAAVWFARLDSPRQREIEEMAKQLDMPLGTYLNGMCMTPAPRQTASKMAGGIKPGA